MLTFVPSKDEGTIAFEFDGKAEEEDAIKMRKVIEEKFPGDRKFNAYAIIRGIETPTFKGMVERIKLQSKHIHQFEKVALISDEYLVEKAENLDILLPGLTARHFPIDEMDKAWDWIKE
ncbi:MAG TPA: STAS/SEC14 domain-containing protein [Planococcus sp. (in: firmicutes)]|nr:STAS/SEC14 domain-containing protein [Planococcus sp. (in: firmicutes)]